jgi:hypothetical protein
MEESLRKARAGKKPWEPPFRRQQLSRTKPVGESPGGPGHFVADASSRRKTGREMEEQGIARRLFPPDPVPEDNKVEQNDPRSPTSLSLLQQSQQSLRQRATPQDHSKDQHDNYSDSAREKLAKHTSVRSTPQGQNLVESLPSPLDGTQMHYSSNTPQSVPSATTKQPPSSVCKNSDHDPSITVKGASKASCKAPKSGLPLWQALLVAMGFIIFVFAFAIIVAHCLAWFIVYRTEARLGEMRSGLLRGGEMKLCLCGRG